MDRLLQKNLKRDEFFLPYSKLLQERLPGSSVEFTGDSALRIVDPEGQEATSYLDNLWLRYSGGDEDRAGLIERHVRMAVGLPIDAAKIARRDIVAMIKDLQYVELLRPGKRQMNEHICGDLWIVYAEDRPETITSLTYDAMIAAGVSEDELRGLAIENLRRILPEPERHGDGPWYLLTAGADYVASLLLFDWVWDQLAESVEGQIVATVPRRDVLMYTGSRSDEGLAEIRKRSVEIVSGGSHVISDSLIIREGGKWAMFNAH